MKNRIYAKIIWGLCGIFISLGAQCLTQDRSHADPEDFCRLPVRASGNFFFTGAGSREYTSTLPSQFWRRKPGKSDPIMLNNHLVLQAPTKIFASTECSMNLFGSGVSPGASTVDSDPLNIGVAADANSFNYGVNETQKLHPLGVKIETNSGLEDGYGDDEDDY